MASGRERTVGQSRRGADMAAPYRFGCAGAERQVVARCNAWRRCNGVAVRRRSGDADLSLASPASNSGRQHRGADRQPPLDSRPAARRYSIRARRRSRYSATRVGRISRSAPHDWRCERRFSTRRASRGGCAVTRGGHGPDAIRGAGVRRGNGNYRWRGATDDTRASIGPLEGDSRTIVSKASLGGDVSRICTARVQRHTDRYRFVEWDCLRDGH